MAADGTATIDFTGDASRAQAAMDRLTRDNAKMREQIRLTNEESVRGSKKAVQEMERWSAGMSKLQQQNDKWALGMTRMAESMRPIKSRTKEVAVASDDLTTALSGMGIQIAAVAAVSGFAMKVYGEWRQRTDELSSAHEHLAQSMTKALAESGKLALAPQAEQFVKNIKGATPAQATAALAGVMGSGETLADSRTFDVAGKIARLAPTGIDLTQAGGVAGDVADIMGEGTSAEDVADTTVGLKQMLRDKIGQFSDKRFQKNIEKLKMSGMSGEDAMTAAVAALQSEQGAASLDVLNKKGRKTRADKLMMSEVFNRENLDRVKTQMQGFRTDNLAQQQLDLLKTSTLTGGQNVQTIVDEAETENILGVDPNIARVRKFIRERARGRGMGAYGVAVGSEAVSHFQQATGVEAENRRRWQAMTPEQRSALEAQGRFGGSQAEAMVGQAFREGTISKGDMQEMIQALRENTLATKANTGPQKNVNAHNEGRGQ
jgi:hypothetical protein